MSSCEKCWRDAQSNAAGCVSDEYHRLIRERADHPCTPEEQAGPDAGECFECKRRTLHQITKQCMAGCRGLKEAVFRENFQLKGKIR